MVCLKIAAVLMILSMFAEALALDVSHDRWRDQMERFAFVAQNLSMVYVCLAVLYL